jgi:thiosulfate dehydrogenase
MKALLTDIRFISAGVPTGRGAEGRGAPLLPLPTVASDSKHGATVFAAPCAVCHQADGQGTRWGTEEAAQGHRYQVPSLWGSDSYNEGSGMARPITAAGSIRANMPRDIEYDHRVLDTQDAFDVAVFFDSQQRAYRLGNEQDFPDRSLKPANATDPPFVGPFPPSQHPTGPWQPIRQWLNGNAQNLPTGLRLRADFPAPRD